MKILALDISSSNSGVAIWDTDRGLSSIMAMSIKCEGDTSFDKVNSFHRQLVRIIKQHRPDYAVFEEPLPNIPSFEVEGEDLAGGYARRAVNAKSSLILNRLAGSAHSILKGFGIAQESASAETWRKAFLGYGRKKGFKRPDYKKAAKKQCEMERIPVRNVDEAEAAGLAFWCGRSSQRFKMFQVERARA